MATMPSATEGTRATYASMAQKQQGQQQQPLPPDAPPSIQGKSKSSAAPRDSRPRGRGGGYQKPPPPSPRQQHHGRKRRGQGEEDEDDVYVVTLLTDAAHERAMSALRRRWFPAHRLKVDAHLTLFHALPGRLLGTLKDDLAAAAAAEGMGGAGGAGGRGGCVPDGTEGGGGPRRVGEMRRGLIERWEALGEEGAAATAGVLSAQDARRDWKAHYTIMNKEEDPARVEACFRELRDGLGEVRAEVLGLRLWRYDRGWWRQEQDFMFAGGRSQ
ncbi:hypothetical protein PG999_014360 [Apiospora kogelbergensis]|uniref:2'-5' RNA ligase superfamily protein n=1 Tax=Apiospora kogelbergensis TaxID=1337665 RepID=A0AAW0Q638_9PEZI